MKKIIIGVFAFILLLGGIMIVIFNSPDVFIGISKPIDENADLYIEQIVVGGNGRFGMPIPERTKKQLEEIDSIATKTSMEIATKYDNAHIEIDVLTENGQTILIYEGTVINKTTNEEEEYIKKITFDFIPTKNIG